MNFSYQSLFRLNCLHMVTKLLPGHATTADVGSPRDVSSGAPVAVDSSVDIASSVDLAFPLAAAETSPTASKSLSILLEDILLRRLK